MFYAIPRGNPLSTCLSCPKPLDGSFLMSWEGNCVSKDFWSICHALFKYSIHQENLCVDRKYLMSTLFSSYFNIFIATRYSLRSKNCFNESAVASDQMMPQCRTECESQFYIENTLLQVQLIFFFLRYRKKIQMPNSLENHKFKWYKQ